MKTTHRRLRGWYEALRELGARFAPTVPADIKISRLLTPVMRAWEPLSNERAKIGAGIMRHYMDEYNVRSAEELPKSVQQLLAADIVSAQLAWDIEVTEVEMPERFITQADLPRERTGDDGWKNGAGLGGLIAELGELFEQPKD